MFLLLNHIGIYFCAALRFCFLICRSIPFHGLAIWPFCLVSGKVSTPDVDRMEKTEPTSFIFRVFLFFFGGGVLSCVLFVFLVLFFQKPIYERNSLLEYVETLNSICNKIMLRFKMCIPSSEICEL